MSVGPLQLIIILVIVLLLFGRGRIAGVMGDFGKGIKAMRDGLKGEDDGKSESQKQVADKKSSDDSKS